MEALERGDTGAPRLLPEGLIPKAIRAFTERSPVAVSLGTVIAHLETLGIKYNGRNSISAALSRLAKSGEWAVGGGSRRLKVYGLNGFPSGDDVLKNHGGRLVPFTPRPRVSRAKKSA